LLGIATVPTRRGTFKFIAVVPFGAVKETLAHFTASQAEQAGIAKIGEDLGDAIAYDAARRACRAELVKCIRSKVKRRGEVGSFLGNLAKGVGKGVTSLAKTAGSAAAKLTELQLQQLQKGAEYSLQKYTGVKLGNLPVVENLVKNVPPPDGDPNDALAYGKYAASIINHAKKGDPWARLAIRQVTSAARAGHPEAAEAAAAMESITKTLQARDNADDAAAASLSHDRGRGSGVRMFAGRFPHTNETLYLTSHYRSGVVAGL
jgi:hypothetical protein